MPSEEKLIPEVNIGIIGHVDHGKTTLTEALTGKFTDEHSEELKRGITIRLGYADLTIMKCPKCKGSQAYTNSPKCFSCASKTKILRTLSIVDVPGHETLMATVLTGASLMDGAILVIAANEKCPQPQTEEHLEVLNLAGIKNIIIVQNKIDLVSEEEAKKSYESIKKFVSGSVAENAPIIPVSAQHRINIDFLLQAMEENIKTPEREAKKDPLMLIARSFDINRPGTDIKKLKGGVIGGSLIQGELKENDVIELRPGIKIKDSWQPIQTKIKSIVHGKTPVKTGKQGGLLALGTELDPYLAKSDSFVGNLAGLPEKLPPVWSDIKLEIRLLKRVLGTKEKEQITDIKKGEAIMMNAGTAKTLGVCTKPGKISEFQLKLPVCASPGDKVALSKQVLGRWRLIGEGTIRE